MRLLGQGEGDVGISGSGAHFAAAASDDDVLFAVGEVGGGGGVASGGEFGFPEFLAIGLVKGAEVFVFGCPDEEEAACGGDGAAIVFSSGGRDTLGGEFGEFAQGDRPEVFARVEIDGIEGSPRGFDGGVAIGIEEAVIACMGEGDDAEGLAPGGGFLGGIRCFVAIDEGDDTFSLALAEEGEGRHDAFSGFELVEGFLSGAAVLDPFERWDGAGRVSGEVDAVAGGAELVIDLVSAGVGEFSFLGLGIDHGEDPGHFVGVDVEDAVGVGGCAAPFSAAVEAGEDDGAFAAGGEEGLVWEDTFEFGESLFVGFWRDVGDQVFGEDLAGEWGGDGWKGLVGPGEFAGESGGWGRGFVDGEEGFTGGSVEDKDVAGLGDLGDGIDAFAVVFHREEIGGGGEVAVPDIVVDELEVPDAFAGFGVEGQEAVGEEVGTHAVAAPEVEGCGTCGDEDHAALLIDGHTGPGIGTADIFPCFRGPGFVSVFAGVRDGMEDPLAFSGMEVIGADMAGCGGAGAF